MKAHYYSIASGEIVLIQDAHDPAAATEAGYDDPTKYGVLFCSDPDAMEYIDGQWRAKMTLDQLKTAKLEEIKAEYEVERTTRNKGIESITLGVKIDCREKDVLNIQSIVYVYDATGMAPTFYKAYDNSEVTATGEDFKAVLTELIAAQLAMWQHKNELSRQIAAATTPEQIKSIKWSW